METADTGAAEYVSLRRGDSLSWEDLAELASDAGAESALLSLFVTAEFTVLFIVRAGWDAPRVIQASLSAARWEDAQRRLFREVARSFGSSRLEQTWDVQLQSLLREAAPYVAGASRLVVAPMAAGHLLPWSLLADRAGWRGPDGSVPAVVTLPALGLLPRLRRHPVRSAGPVLVVGDPAVTSATPRRKPAVSRPSSGLCHCSVPTRPENGFCGTLARRQPSTLLRTPPSSADRRCDLASCSPTA